MGDHVGFESWLERDHLMFMDFDPAITGIASQPFWLRWQDEDGRDRRHPPDFFARRADGSGLVVDVRPDDRIPPEDAEVFRVTALACGQAGWEFRRAGTIDPVVRANVRWLSRYRHQRCRREPAAAELLEAFTPGMPLLPGAAQVGDPVAVLPVAPAAWRAVNAYGIKVSHRTYDAEELNPIRQQESGVAAQKGKWEVHHDPYDVSRVFVRGPDGWITCPWKYLEKVPAPFGELAWDHISGQLAEQGHPAPSELDRALAVDDLLSRAYHGPPGGTGPDAAGPASPRRRRPEADGQGPEGRRPHARHHGLPQQRA